MNGPTLRINDSGRYEIVFHDGRRTRYRSTRTSDPAKAAAALAEFANGKPAARALRLGKILEAYEDRYVDRHTAPSTRPGLHSMCRRLRASLSAYRVTEGRQAADAWLDERTGAGIAPGTVRKEILALQAAMNWAAREGLVAPESVPKLELPAKPPGRVRWLREDEAKRLLASAAQGRRGPRCREPVPRVEAFCRLGLALGPRRQSLERLTWDRVDLEAGLIDFREPGAGETAKRRPRVPIPARERELLETMADAAATEWVLYRPGSVYPAFVTARKRAGLGKDVTPHVLRHTYATWALHRGVSVWEVAKVLGDTVRTVEETYGHPDDLRAAVDF